MWFITRQSIIVLWPTATFCKFVFISMWHTGDYIMPLIVSMDSILKAQALISTKGFPIGNKYSGLGIPFQKGLSVFSCQAWIIWLAWSRIYCRCVLFLSSSQKLKRWALARLFRTSRNSSGMSFTRFSPGSCWMRTCRMRTTWLRLHLPQYYLHARCRGTRLAMPTHLEWTHELEYNADHVPRTAP